MQTTEIQAIYAIPLQNTKYTSHSYRALPPQPEVKLFLLLFGGLCLLCESKSGSGPQSYSRYVQHTTPWSECIGSVQRSGLPMWKFHLLTSATHLVPDLPHEHYMFDTFPASHQACIIVNLTLLLLRYSKGRRDGFRMCVPYMTHGKFGTLLLPILFFPYSIYWKAWHSHIVSSPTEATAHVLRTA